MQSLVRKIYRLQGHSLGLSDGAIVRRESLSALRTAQAVIAAADKQAEEIRRVAREQAIAEAQELRVSTHEAVWKYAAQLQHEFADMQTAMFHAAHGSLSKVIARLLERLCLDATARERLGSAIHMILREACDAPRAVMSLSSSDEANVSQELMNRVEALGWRIEFTARLQAGECELNAGAVEWKTSLAQAANALREPFVQTSH